MPPMHDEAPAPVRDDQRCSDLLACYRSGQVSERQWQEHLALEPGLAEYVMEMSL